MHHQPSSRLVRVAAALGVTAAGLAVGAGPASAAPFLPGNLVVYRVGNGTGTLTSAANPVFLDEFSPAGGAPVGSVSLPTAVSGPQRALTASGSATSEGLLTRSTDGRYLVLTGYNAAPGTASVVSTSAATVNRVIGRVDAGGTIDTSTALSDAFDANNIRSATSIDGTSFWATGANSGVRYVSGLGASTSTQLSTTVTNLRQVAIFDNQLYVSTSSGSAVRVGTVGAGTPTTPGQTISNLPGFPVAGSPYAFSFVDVDGNGANETLYVADDGATGGIQKYVLSGGTFTAKGTITAPSVRGLTASVLGGVVSLYATNGSALLGATDSSGLGGTASGAATTLATAPANQAFRGVAFAPIAAPTPPPPVIPEAPWAALLPVAAIATLGGMVMVRRRAAA